MGSEEKIRKAYASILGHDFERAIEWFEQAVREEPDNPEPHYKLSITYARSNKLEKALRHAQIAFRLSRGKEKYRFHLRHLLGRTYAAEAEKYVEHEPRHLKHAVTLLKKAIMLDPLSGEAHLLLAIAYAELHEYEQAVQALNEVLELDPQNEIAKKLQHVYNTHLH